MSHELREPLASIKDSAAALLEEASQLDPAEMRKFHRIIVEQARHMRGLIGGYCYARINYRWGRKAGATPQLMRRESGAPGKRCCVRPGAPIARRACACSLSRQCPADPAGR